MTSDRHDDYLWDGTGEPDPDVVRLEQVLGTLRHDGPLGELAPLSTADDRLMQDAPASFGRRAWYVVSTLAAAAALILMAGAAWLTVLQPRIGWAVESLAGDPAVNGQTVGRNSRLAVGGWLETDTASRARINAGPIGRIVVEPNTRVQLVEARGREHRMALAQGTIHARIWAPPKFFYVNTPAAVAVDLGCAYTLHVDPDGSGLVRVTHGWVAFQNGDRESFIPEQAVCATRPGVGPGTPRYEDAPDVYAAALELLDFGDPSDSGRGAALDLVLSRARPRDALTLWHLLRRGSPDERARVYERMTSVSPPPSGVTREAILRGDRSAIDAWWNSLGLDSTTWWRMWKKNW
jgi:hypothetical protein